MAFRIHDSVVRGEIDNRIKGIVRGRIWLEGRAEPISLELQGNAWPDLAGCRLTFTNPLPRVVDPHLDSLNPLQRGIIGDLTASRKVRVYDIPFEEAYALIKQGKHPPEHMANSLYLEWFSEANGRVVIESADYELSISPPEWRMTPEENEERARQAATGMSSFLQKLTDAIEKHQRGQKDPDEEWDEFDYEKFLKECDARTDKYGELLDKYGNSDGVEDIIAREMGWDRELTEEEAEERQRRIEEINEACEEALDAPEPEPDPQREGIDWIRTEDGDIEHPVQYRCHESLWRFWRVLDEIGWEDREDDALALCLLEWQTTCAKLAGALVGLARGRGSTEPAFIVACLKRALNHLHKAQAALEAAAPEKRLPQDVLIWARRELLEIRQEILRLMDDLRGRR